MCKDNTTVGGITLYVEDKRGHHSVFGHISVQKEKYYIIRIKKWLFGNRLLHLYTKSFGKKIDIFNLIYRYLLAFGR
jgi:hypothetical protein